MDQSAAAGGAGDEGGNRSVQRYFCHSCSAEVVGIGDDFTCPRCHMGFLELMPATTSSTTASESRSSDDDDGHHEQANDRSMREHVENMHNAFQQVFGGMMQQQPPSRNNSNRSMNQNDVGAMPQPQNILQHFLHDLVGNLQAGTQIQFHIGDNGGGAQFFAMPGELHGNIGDYAWGPGGLDQIVTQLLNQFEGGAPALTQLQVDHIPEVEINEQQIANRTQCTTCMDDFRLNERVRRLPCLHHFHRDCIVPWLLRHNTCPICRKPVQIDVNTPSTAATSSLNIIDTIDDLD